MTPEPSVSIIVPCFNQGHFVGAAIDSCLRQTRADLEVIVVDDGSTDFTPFVVKAAADADPRVRIASGPNAGLGAARNRGLAMARGRYVNFLDADDLIAPTKLERQLRVLEQSPDVGLVLCDIRSIDGDGRCLPAPGIHLDRIEHRDGIFLALLETGLFPPHVPLVRRELVEQAGGFEEDRQVAGNADYLLWLSIAAAGVRTAVITEPLAIYRRTPAGMSSDATHMNASRQLALTLLVQRHPQAFANGLIRLSTLLEDARYANAVLQQQVLAKTDPAAAAELGRLRFHDWLLTHRERPMQVWGAGSKGREVLEQLRTLGITPQAFVDRAADGSAAIDGIPVLRPDPGALAGAAVIVASMFHQEIGAELGRMAPSASWIVAP